MIESSVENRMENILAVQKQAQLEQAVPDLAQRRQRLQGCIDLLVENHSALCRAVSEDYGHRSEHLTLGEIQGTLANLKYTYKHLGKWMRPERRPTQFPLNLLGARSCVEYQPKGVVGVVSPWNFPIKLSLVPMGEALATGNRVMLKPSEFSPRTSALLLELVGRYFSEDEVAVVTGGPEVGAAFSALPFDHLFFTGGTSIGRKVMETAAKNLTPLTLELGGKSPVVVAPSANMESTVERLLTAKTQNAGQVCVSPDYVFVREGLLEEFIDQCRKVFVQQYPDPITSPDYTTLINDSHYQRIRMCLEEASEAGARIVPLSDAAPVEALRKFPLHLVIDPDEELAVSQTEIFGPLLIVKTYKNLSECVSYINARPKPLALYLFGEDKSEQDQVLSRTSSGGVTINDIAMHPAQLNLPFGGVGASGMGHYHGHDGFKNFSHARAVFKQGFISPLKLVGAVPPLGDKFKKFIENQLKK
jgi:coniferyl-aldehyde dehydrogenase